MQKLVQKRPTGDQIREIKSWARRLDPKQFEERREWLQWVTNPKAQVGVFYPFKDQRPLTEGWLARVEREGAPCDGPIDISRLETVPFIIDGKEPIGGEEMVRRSRDKRAFPGCQGWGQHQAEQLLVQANELPVEMEKFVLILPDTILVDPGGCRGVSGLVCDDEDGTYQWRLDWYWLGRIFSFGRDCRFLRLCPQVVA